MSLWLTKGFDSQEDDLLPSYLRTACLDLGDFTFFIHLARIQAIASVFNLILTIGLGVFGELSTTIVVHLLRTVALLVIAIVTLHCYSPGGPALKPIVVLQAGWIVSELAFPRSVFAPAALSSTPPVFPRTHQEILILRFGPVSLILLMASCLGFFSKTLKPRRRSQSGSCSEPVIVVQRQGVANSQLPSESHVDTTVNTNDSVDSSIGDDGIDVRSVRSRASSSTDTLFVSGASTPCGPCPPSPNNVVKLVEPGSAVETLDLSDDSVYLTQHVLDTNETVLFVYKRLKPIKTRVEEPPPPPPIPPPSYSHPSNYVSNPLKQDCNDRYSTRSTTKIVRPKYGMDMEGAVMIPRGQRMIPIVATIPL